jgi:hypothetical protein
MSLVVDIVTPLVTLAGGIAAAFVLTRRAHQAADLKEARADAGHLIGLLVKYGSNWGGRSGYRAPVDGYEARGAPRRQPGGHQRAEGSAHRILKARGGEDLSDCIDQLRPSDSPHPKVGLNGCTAS